MTNKVKVTQEQGKVIKKFLDSIDGDKERFLRMHVAGEGIVYWGDYCESLNDLSIMEFAEILVNGYEIEPEPLQVGDWATRKKSRRIINRPSDREGVAFQIVEKGVGVLGSDGNKHAIGALRHATPDEIAEGQERQKWAEIDREVGEIRDGDIGIARNGAVLTDSEDLEHFYKHGDLVGLYPPESAITFGKGDEK